MQALFSIFLKNFSGLKKAGDPSDRSPALCFHYTALHLSAARLISSSSSLLIL